MMSKPQCSNRKRPLRTGRATEGIWSLEIMLAGIVSTVSQEVRSRMWTSDQRAYQSALWRATLGK